MRSAWHAVLIARDSVVVRRSATADAFNRRFRRSTVPLWERTERKRERWRTLFDHYVFQRGGDPAEHIPEPARGILGRSTPELRRFIRQFLVQKLLGR